MRLPSLVLALAAASALAACAGDKSNSDTTQAAAATASSGGGLTGAGATFPYPLYSKWSSEYRAKSGVEVNYQSIGSGGGIKQLQEQTVDFGASDAPMNDAELAAAKGGAVLHIPTVIGAVAVAYNLPEVTQPLKLTGEVTADIFNGKITKWNDPRIAALNSGLPLPATDILVVHRSEGSGTTYVFSDYLSSVSASWRVKPGKGKELQWAVGLGAKGNEAVAGQVKQTPGAVGYMELAYATQNKLSVASIQNAAGQFVAPTVESAAAAAASAVANLPADSDYRVSIVNAPGATSYPITSFTWLLVYKRQPDATKGQAVVDFVKWGLHDGQQFAAPLDFASLPASLVARLDALVSTIEIGAK